MIDWSLVVAAGLVNWLVTTIVVESELGRPLREYVRRRRNLAAQRRPTLPPPFAPGNADRGPWRWLDYLLACHLCTGVWIAIAEALYLGPLVGRGAAGVIFTALIVKAVGHLVLELRPQAWPR